MTAVRALISALPRKELQALDKEIRGLIEASPKKTRVAAVGQKAWFAFMRHCRDTMAERFTEGMKAPEMAVVCKAIRQEDEAVYTAFVEKFKAENSAPASDAEEAATSSEAEAAPLSDAEASSATKPVKRVRLSPEAKAAKEAAEAEEKAQAKAEKARVKAEKEELAAQEKAQKAMLRAEAKANKDALAAEEKAAKAAARAAKSAEKSAEKEAKKAAKA